MYLVMILRSYLNDRKITVRQFADAIGKPYETVKNWVYQQKNPSLESAVMVERETGGHVTASEMIAKKASGCAEPSPHRSRT